jgi:hypothetical protein
MKAELERGVVAQEVDLQRRAADIDAAGRAKQVRPHVTAVIPPPSPFVLVVMIVDFIRFFAFLRGGVKLISMFYMGLDGRG